VSVDFSHFRNIVFQSQLHTTLVYILVASICVG